MNIVIFGADGTLGTELSLTLEGGGHTIYRMYHKNVDISEFSEVRSVVLEISRASRIDVIINCAAVINTPMIENDPQTRTDAFKANVIGPRNLAMICKELDIKLIHISSNYVFSQFTQDMNAEFPVNVYGMHKLLAELYIKDIMNNNFIVMRVGWVYGAMKGRSFIDKFITNVKKHIEAGNFEVDVVYD